MSVHDATGFVLVRRKVEDAHPCCSAEVASLRAEVERLREALRALEEAAPLVDTHPAMVAARAALGESQT